MSPVRHQQLAKMLEAFLGAGNLCQSQRRLTSVVGIRYKPFRFSAEIGLRVLSSADSFMLL